MRALASASHGVGPAVSAAGWCSPRAVRLGTGYWLARCLAGGGREPFQAPGAVRRDSSPSKTPHLQVRTPLTRPERRQPGGDRSPVRAGRPVSSPGVSKMPLRQYQRAASGPGGVHLAVVRLRPGRGHLPGTFRPCRSSRLRRFAPLRASQVCSLRGSWARAVFKAATAQLHGARLLQPTLGFMPFRRLPLCLCSSILSVPWFPLVPIRKDRRSLAAFAGASPVMLYPSERFSSSAAVPTVTGGRFPLAVAGRCADRRVVANHDAIPLASAGLRAFLRCRVRSAKVLLPAPSARCSPGLVPEEGGRSASARAERRSRLRAR
jgi:hypothetical protein